MNLEFDKAFNHEKNLIWRNLVLMKIYIYIYSIARTYVLSFTFFKGFSQPGRTQTCPAATNSSSNCLVNDQSVPVNDVRDVVLAVLGPSATPRS
jgi:hypothetical protein